MYSLVGDGFRAYVSRSKKGAEITKTGAYCFTISSNYASFGGNLHELCSKKEPNRPNWMGDTVPDGLGDVAVKKRPVLGSPRSGGYPPGEIRSPSHASPTEMRGGLNAPRVSGKITKTGASPPCPHERGNAAAPGRKPGRGRFYPGYVLRFEKPFPCRKHFPARSFLSLRTLHNYKKKFPCRIPVRSFFIQAGTAVF